MSRGLTAVVAAAVLVLSWLVAAPPPTATAGVIETPTWGNGDCWRSGTPYTCKTSWQGRSSYIYFRLIDNFSDHWSIWRPHADAARAAWDTAPGPQYVKWTANPNDSWVYVDDAGTNDEHNGVKMVSGVAGLTDQCDRTGWCTSDLSKAINAMWSDVWINRDVVNPPLCIWPVPCLSDAQKNHLFAHEYGHAFLLAHNTATSVSVMVTPIPGSPQTGPTKYDIGTYPGCYGGALGVNCVFGWGR